MKPRGKSAVATQREHAAAIVHDAAPQAPATNPLHRQPGGEAEGLGTSAGDLDNLLVSTNIAIVLLDRRKCIRRFTPAATALFSFLPTDIGRPIRDLSPKFSDPTFLADAREVLASGKVSKKEVQSREGRWYVRETLPYLLREGTIEGAVITFSEVAADALQEARLYAESIVNSVREPLLVLDGDLRIHSVNQPFSALFAVRGQEAVGHSLRDIDDGIWNVAELLSQLADVLETGRSMESFEFAYQSATLGPRALLLSARTLHRGGSRPALILMAVDDVTERRRIEAAMLLNEERLREEERVRQWQLELTNALRVSTVGELAAGLAHELNQPLSSISNTVEACAQNVKAGGAVAGSAKLLELLDDVATESVRAAGIVAHLRSFVEKGEPQFEPVDLKEIVSHVPDLLVRELDRTRVELHVDVPKGPVRIDADRIQIEQVMVNLLQNAMDSIREAERPYRRIELSVRSVKGMGEVSVRDTGTGVSDSASERLFQPFYTTKTQGLGMGLALSRSILEAHRGRIWMEAPADGGPGTIVRFSIPLRAAQRRRKDPVT